MVGETNLQQLLRSMSPKVLPEEYVFCSVQGQYGDFTELSPIAVFVETEGLSLVITKSAALSVGLAFDSVFKAMTLSVHSSLDAVGLTAAVSTKLAEKGISANVIAAYYHDHIFVHSETADRALEALYELSTG